MILKKQCDINSILLHESISFKARGLFYTLLQVYGIEFEISRQEILTLSEKDKSISTYSAIKELEKMGFLKRSYIRKNGKIYTIKINLIIKNNDLIKC